MIRRGPTGDGHEDESNLSMDRGNQLLIDVESGKVIDRIPYRSDFDVLRRRCSAEEFDRMVGRINELIDEAGAEIATAR